MHPIQHTSNNRVFGAPQQWNQDVVECKPLAVTCSLEAGVGPRITSYWKPTAQEIQQLSAGGSIALHIYGTGLPPVWLEVEDTA